MLLESISDTNEIFAPEMFAMVAGAIASGEQLRSKGITFFLDDNAAAGCLIKASSELQIILAVVGSFRG